MKLIKFLFVSLAVSVAGMAHAFDEVENSKRSAVLAANICAKTGPSFAEAEKVALENELQKTKPGIYVKAPQIVIQLMQDGGTCRCVASWTTSDANISAAALGDQLKTDFAGHLFAHPDPSITAQFFQSPEHFMLEVHETNGAAGPVFHATFFSIRTCGGES